MATVITNKAIADKFAKSGIKVSILKDEEGKFTLGYYIQTEEGYLCSIKGIKKVSDLTPAKWAERVQSEIENGSWFKEENGKYVAIGSLSAVRAVQQKCNEAFQKVAQEVSKPETETKAPETETKEKEEKTQTTLLSQYRDMKTKHPDALLLFRCGDFYEMYDEDAVYCAKTLGITLTVRNSDKVKMAGFPYHALDTYLPKLIRSGRRCAICDQLEAPRKTKTLVKRGITEIVKPASTDKTEEPEKSQDDAVTSVKEDVVMPEKPKKEKKAKKSDAVTLDDIQKLASRMYQKFNANVFDPDGQGTHICVMLKYKSNEYFHILVTVKSDGDMRFSLPSIASVTPTSESTIDYILRLNFFLQDKKRQQKLSDIIAKYFAKDNA